MERNYSIIFFPYQYAENKPLMEKENKSEKKENKSSSPWKEKKINPPLFLKREGDLFIFISFLSLAGRGKRASQPPENHHLPPHP